MQEIAFEIDAQRVGRASGYLGGLTVERYTFTGATIPAGTRLAILTRAGVTIAAAEIAEGNAATVDTNTQEVADLLRYQPLGACESVYIALGNADTIIALIPAVMRKNWLDDEATHPPTPVNRYPTKAELDQWLARFDERAAATETAKADAQEAASQAAQRATAAQTAKAAAETAKTAAQTAQGNAEAAQAAAETAATAAGESAEVAAASEQTALSAKQSAETAQAQAQASEQAAKASEAAAKGAETAARASEQAANASEQAAASSETAAAESASAANASEQAAKASEQASAESATAAQASEQAAATSATAAEAAKIAAETAKTGAEAAQTAAASSATAAANSAAAAKQSETNLADAVATAESLDGRLSAIEPSALRAKDVVISNNNNTYADGAFSYNPAIETFYNTGTIETGAYFLAYCTGLKWVYASHWDKIGSNAFRDCYSLTEVKGSVWRVPNMNDDSSAIGSYAFCNCTNLEKMPPVSNDIKTFESGHWAGVRIIDYRAFYNCRKLPAQFVKDIISSPALWSIKHDVFNYCCLDSGGIDELVLGKNIVFNSAGAFGHSGVKRVDCSQMVKDPMFNAQFFDSLLEEFILPQRQFSYYNNFYGLKYLRYVKMPPEEPVVLFGSNLFNKSNSFSMVDKVTVEFPITRAEAEAWTKYQFIVLDSFPLEKTVFNFTDEQGVTYNA